MYKLACITVDSRRSRQKITIVRYELRLYGNSLGESPYFRNRNSGQNPQVLLSTLSGHGPPKYWRKIIDLVNRNDENIDRLFIERYDPEQNLFYPLSSNRTKYGYRKNGTKYYLSHSGRMSLDRTSIKTNLSRCRYVYIRQLRFKSKSGLTLKKRRDMINRVYSTS